MNYYRRYIGDFQRDTGHLSLAEIGAYDRLLDHFYATERGLPAEIDLLCRIARAVTKDEQAAVKAIAEQYFPVYEDGLRHNPRADLELGKAEPVIAAARTNGVRGGRPKKNPLGFREEPNGGQPPTTNHQPPTSKPPTTEPPTSNHQGKASAPRARRASRKTPLPDGFEVSDRVKDWASRKGFDRLDQHLESFVGKAKAKGYTYVDWDEALMTAIREDWAGLRSGRRGSGVAERNEQAAREWLDGGASVIDGNARRIV